MALHTRFETLLLYDPNRSPATANVWISHPSPSEEQVLGKLVIMSSLKGKDRMNLDVITLIQEELRTAYYQSTDAKPERALEQALQQLNRRLHQVISDGVSQWVDSAAIVIAAVWRESIMMSTIGGVHAFLLRRSRMHDLLGPPDNSPINPVRLFSQVVSGELQPEDQLLICTPTLLDYFSLEKLRRTMVDGRPSATIHQWETTLLGVEQRNAFAAVIVQAMPSETVLVPASRPVHQSTLSQSAPQVSMEHLIAKEQATERLLKPSIWPAIRDIGSQVGQGLNGFVRRTVLRKPPRRLLHSSSSIVAPARTSGSLWSTIERLFVSAGTFFVRVAGVFIPRRSAVQQTPAPVTMSPNLRRRWRLSLNSIIRWLQQLHPRQQLLLGASVLLVLILAVTVLPRGSARNTGGIASDPVVAIADHLSQAKAALLYGGESTAEQNVDAAQQLINKLPNRSKTDKAARQALQDQVKEVQTQLAHATTIQPMLVADISAVAPNTNPQQLYLVGSKLVTLDPTTSSVTSFAIGKTNAPTVIVKGQDTGAPMTGAVLNTALITFVTDRNTFVDLDTAKGAWTPIDSAWPTTQPHIQSLATYNNRVYALDTAHQIIVRFAHAASSLGTGADWLKEPATLGGARGLAVDGSLYVLQPQGVVELYANGRKSVFTLPTITPKLSDPTRIWTDSATTNIFLLDPANRRIVVISKTGKLVDQYTSPSWTALRDIAVNVKTKAAYVLNGTALSSFTLLH